MSHEGARGYAHYFEECQTRIQTLGELLLITCKPHPVFTHQEDLAATEDNYVRYRDEVISHLNKLLILSRDISSQTHADTIHWKSLRVPLIDLTSTIVQLIQLSSHIAYLLALNSTGSKAAVLGPVSSKHRLVQADLELKFVCTRLKRSRVGDLTPRLLVDLCGTITKSLSALTDICRIASEKIIETSEQDQFKLCIKAITSTAGCLVSSVKSFKHSADDRHIQRLACFCQPLVSTSAALVAFATEEQFLGTPAVLSPDGNEVYKSVIGLAMSMVSACVQITKALRDLIHDHTRTKHKDRISLCVESISRAASRLRDLLLSYDFSSPEDSLSKIKADASSFSPFKLPPVDNERDPSSLSPCRVNTDAAADDKNFLSSSGLPSPTGKKTTASSSSSTLRSPKSKRSSSKSASSKSKRRSSSHETNALTSSPKTPPTPVSPLAISNQDPSSPSHVIEPTSSPSLSPYLSSSPVSVNTSSSHPLSSTSLSSTLESGASSRSSPSSFQHVESGLALESVQESKRES